ncbi:ankyrin repeat-containing domain protein [Mycena galopus ATCC 62051]|nr:ankyrin repeat-containing domain protein [Mycena galopus ATCC 62051]
MPSGDSQTINNHIRGGVGGHGGAGHAQGIGGRGGPGEGPILNYTITAGQFTMNNNIGEHASHQRQLDSIRNEQQQHNKAAMHDHIMQWITPLNFFQRQQLIFETRQAGTGEWLLADTKFRDWVSNSGKVLWCRGIPGAGKTVLASLVVNHLRVDVQARNDNIGVACIYLDHKDTEAQTVRNLLASLWKQLAVDKPVPAATHELHGYHRKRGTNPALNDILQILHSITTEYSKIYFVVDALDEYPELKRDVLFEHLSKVVEVASVNLLLTSRPHITLHPYFPDAATLDIRANEDDLHQVVDEYIYKSRNLSKHIRAHPELQEEIRTKIVNESNGMFLVPKLHLDYLNQKKTLKALRDALHQSPKTLTNFYDQAIERIQSDENEDNRNAARLALIWVANAKRLLSVAELREALAVERGARFLDPASLMDIVDVISVCAGLIIEETPHIRLVHPTTQEYLDSIRASQFPDAHSIIASTCFTYLSFDCFSDSNLTLDPLANWVAGNTLAKDWVGRNPLLAYAPHCLTHVVGEPELVLYDEIKEFFKHAHKWKQLFKFLPCDPPWNYAMFNLPELFSPLWIAAASNLTKVFSQLSAENPLSLNATIEGCSMLSAAAHYGHLDMVRLLVDTFGVDVNAPYRSPALYAASRNGHESVARFLLEHGAEPNVADVYGKTALHAATVGGHISVVDALCRHGVNLNAKGAPAKETLLGLAFSQGNLEVVRRSLEYGANVNQLPFGVVRDAAHAGHSEVVRLMAEKTVLYTFWAGGRADMFRFFLENGADVNVAGPKGTILHELCTTSRNHPLFPLVEEFIFLVINKGANTNARGPHGTPLGCAAFRGWENICRVLIQHGADVNIRWTDADGVECDALCLAAYGGHETSFNILVESGADMNLAAARYGSSLRDAWTRGRGAFFGFLLENGVDVNAVGPGGTILHELCSTNENHPLFPLVEEFIFLVINKGANTNARGPHGTPLACAAFSDQENICRILIKHGADVNLKWTGKDGVECDALRLAALGGHETCFNLLVMNGADINLRRGWHETVLHDAWIGGRDIIFRFLLQNGADVNAVGPGGTILHVLCSTSKNHPLFLLLEKFVVLLMENGANANMEGGQYGTPLGCAAFTGQQNICRILLEHGADASISWTDNDGVEWDALGLAGCGGHEACFTFLVENGANLNLRRRWHGIPLHVAWAGGTQNIFRFLLENGADVNVFGPGGTILHVLCSTSKEHPLISFLEEFVVLLVKKGANVNAEGGLSGTPLGCAAFNGQENICRILIRHGADVNISWTMMNGTKCNALWAAAFNGHGTGCFNLLKKHTRSLINVS